MIGGNSKLENSAIPCIFPFQDEEWQLYLERLMMSWTSWLNIKFDPSSIFASLFVVSLLYAYHLQIKCDDSESDA